MACDSKDPTTFPTRTQYLILQKHVHSHTLIVLISGQFYSGGIGTCVPSTLWMPPGAPSNYAIPNLINFMSESPFQFGIKICQRL